MHNTKFSCGDFLFGFFLSFFFSGLKQHFQRISKTDLTCINTEEPYKDCNVLNFEDYKRSIWNILHLRNSNFGSCGKVYKMEGTNLASLVTRKRNKLENNHLPGLTSCSDLEKKPYWHQQSSFPVLSSQGVDYTVLNIG